MDQTDSDHQLEAANDHTSNVAVATGPLKLLVLHNGDKLTGSIESMMNGVYTVITRSGTLRIAAAEIREIRDAVPNAAVAAPPAQAVRRGQ